LSVSRASVSLRGFIGIVVGGLALAVGVAFATAADRDALWGVVRACVADKRVTGLPFPCLSVDISEGEARGGAVLRPPWSNDLIFSPTRRVIGVEDPFLQTPEAPNYFAAAWRARGMIATANGKPPVRDQIALVVNSGPMRDQDQLHIHIGCLTPSARAFLTRSAPALPWDIWRPVGAVTPHQSFWALRVRDRGLEGVDPFQLARAELGHALRNPADLTVAVAGGAEDSEFLILATYAHAPHSWWPVGSNDILDRRCRGDGEPGE
jgi:CDP-diacylglycerol pyrophosphatase